MKNLNHTFKNQQRCTKCGCRKKEGKENERCRGNVINKLEVKAKPVRKMSKKRKVA